MEIIKPGKPLIVPTEQAECPECGAILAYTAADVLSPPWEPPLKKNRGGEVEIDEKAMAAYRDKHDEEERRYRERATIFCPCCGKSIDTGKMPGQPHR